MSQFYEDLLEYYDDIFPLEEARIRFIEMQILRQPGASPKIMDIGCATGSTAVALIKKGYTVTGIDLNAAMIQSANRRNPEPKTNGRFMQMDMRDVANFFPTSSFDGILCLGNTLTHLRDAGEIGSFLNKIRKLLKQGAPFIFQVINYDLVLDNKLQGLPDVVTSRCRFVRRYDPIPGEPALRFTASLYSSTDQLVFKDETRLYPVRAAELNTSLQNAGFDKIEYYKDFSGVQFDETSIAIVGVASVR